MSLPRTPPKIKGRSIGIVALTVAQAFIGVIHIIFGLLLLAYSILGFNEAMLVYDIYTVIFGALTTVFAVLIWQGKVAGWIGVVAVSLFVVAADSLTMLNLPSIPGIPKLAGVAEIIWSVIVIAYLLATWQRRAALTGQSLTAADAPPFGE